MFFAHDTTQNFYYYGEVEPYGRLYHDYLDSAKLIGVDTETISLKERIAIGVGIAVQPNICFYFPLFPETSSAIPWHLLKDPKVAKVFHNALFDLGCMREYEIDTTNIKDTSVMAHLLCYPFARLTDLSYVHQMEVHDVRELLPKGHIMLDLEQEVVARKCMQDAGACLKLFYEFMPDIDTGYFNTEMELIPILIEMSNRGILIDQEARLAQEEILEDEVEGYLKLCHESEGFNPGSPQQVAYILAKRGSYNIFPKLPFTRGRSKRNLSSAKEVLTKMDDPLAGLVLNYRDKSYLLSHYIKPWANEERATTRFHMDAITGRISSTDRNLANIPKGEPRGMFLPDSGIWTDMDFNQVELRLLAYLSQDREMLHIYETEGDIHQATMDYFGIMRVPAKKGNFSMVYGATDETIMESMGLRSRERARQFREGWFQLFPQAGDWIQSTQAQALIHNRVKTVFGRSIRLPTEEEERIDGRQRKAVNYPIQGSAAEILKRALIHCKDMPMALQVHDEILIDSYIPADKFKPLESIAPFRTPVEVKYLTRWE